MNILRVQIVPWVQHHLCRRLLNGRQSQGYSCQTRMINSPAQSIFVEIKGDDDSGLTVSAL